MREDKTSKNKVRACDSQVSTAMDALRKWRSASDSQIDNQSFTLITRSAFCASFVYRSCVTDKLSSTVIANTSEEKRSPSESVTIQIYGNLSESYTDEQIDLFYSQQCPFKGVLHGSSKIERNLIEEVK